MHQRFLTDRLYAWHISEVGAAAEVQPSAPNYPGREGHVSVQEHKTEV